MVQVITDSIGKRQNFCPPARGLVAVYAALLEKTTAARWSMLRLLQLWIRPPLAIPHAHGAAVTEVPATGKRNAIHLNGPFDGRISSQLATGSEHALAQANESALTAQREAERDLLGRVESGVEPARRLERLAR